MQDRDVLWSVLSDVAGVITSLTASTHCMRSCFPDQPDFILQVPDLLFEALDDQARVHLLIHHHLCMQAAS